MKADPIGDVLAEQANALAHADSHMAFAEGDRVNIYTDQGDFREEGIVRSIAPDGESYEIQLESGLIWGWEPEENLTEYTARSV